MIHEVKRTWKECNSVLPFHRHFAYTAKYIFAWQLLCTFEGDLKCVIYPDFKITKYFVMPSLHLLSPRKGQITSKTISSFGSLIFGKWSVREAFYIHGLDGFMSYSWEFCVEVVIYLKSLFHRARIIKTVKIERGSAVAEDSVTAVDSVGVFVVCGLVGSGSGDGDGSLLTSFSSGTSW